MRGVQGEEYPIGRELFEQTYRMLDEDEISDEENERRFRESLKIIENLTHEELVELMGEEFLEEFKKVSR
jgi:hypothetical protein